MYSARWTLVLCIAAFCISPAGFAQGRKSARLSPIPNKSTQDLRVRARLSAADTCFVSQNDEILMVIEGWVAGAELYKSYMDPAANCNLPYPFTIVEINMPMSFSGGTTLLVSVDVEEPDTSTFPGCAVPGRMLALSQDWQLTVPAGGGIFNIWIPLDSPIVVNGPFFAGFFIGNIIDPTVNAALLIDTFPVPCATYNIWDEAVGWVDLTDNGFFNFPGRLAMEVSGIPGGQSGSDNPPQATFLSPTSGDNLFGSTELWVSDTAGSMALDHAIFEYSISGGPFVEIGRDFDGFSPLRDGVNIATTGTGFSTTWDFSNLPEGMCTLRATLVDTIGRTSSSLVTVSLEPTPPTPVIISPGDGEDFCQPLTILMNNFDENLSFIQVERHDAAPAYSSGFNPVSQFTAGDVNGNPNDGNFAANGEFGNYYSGPIVAAMALKLWESRGVIATGAAGPSSLTTQQVSEQLAVDFQTRANFGTFDELLYSGLRTYINRNGGNLVIDNKRHPDYFAIREWVEEEQRAVMLGLSGPSGIWVGVEGFFGWRRVDGNYDVTIVSPLTGAVETLPLRNAGAYSELFFNRNWHRIDLMVSLSPADWTISRQLIAIDMNGGDGWSINWTPTGLKEDSLYFFRAVGRDATSLRDSRTILLRYQCSSFYAKGDYNNDGTADVNDLSVLIDFLTVGGAAPVGGGLRADANCDNFVNIADVVYFINFLFGTAGSPCH